MIFKKKFEWNDNKEKINIAKHGISFKQASKVFDDCNSIVIYDTLHSIDEERFNIIGMINGIYFIVYTIRENGRTRIISARKANKKEENIYYENLLRKWS